MKTCEECGTKPEFEFDPTTGKHTPCELLAENDQNARLRLRDELRARRTAAVNAHVIQESVSASAEREADESGAGSQERVQCLGDGCGGCPGCKSDAGSDAEQENETPETPVVTEEEGSAGKPPLGPNPFEEERKESDARFSSDPAVNNVE